MFVLRAFKPISNENSSKITKINKKITKLSQKLSNFFGTGKMSFLKKIKTAVSTIKTFFI